MKKFQIFFIILLISGSLYADETTKVINKLQKVYNSAVDFSANFGQKTFNRTLNKWVDASGKVYFKKKGKMRWEYKGDNAQLIVSDGVTMWIYQPEAKQVLVSNIRSSLSKTPANFLEGIGRLKEDFNYKLLKLKDYPNNKYYSVEFIPKEKNPNLSRMIIIMKKNNFNIVEIRTFDFFHNENRISFSGSKINSKLSDKIFSFKPPKGTIIRKMR